MKEKDTKYIQTFSKITIRAICEELGLLKDYENIISGRSSEEKIHSVKEEIKNKLKSLKG